jgi:hypothetical protein
MDANCLFAKLLSIFLNHFFATFGNNVSLGLGDLRLLLHTKIAHLASIQSLLSVFQIAHIRLEGFKIT